MKSHSTETVCVIDNGLFTSLAERLARDFKRVLYYASWEAAYPKMNEAYIGYGLKDVERVESIWPHFDEIDLFVFPDLFYGPMQVWLESHGKRVWGSRNGEELEIYREVCKEQMAKAGLPVGPYEVVKGIDKLRAYLKAHENVWVKVDQWRGTFESFKSSNYRNVEPKLQEIEYQLGPLKNIIDFVVDDDLPDKIEVGIDAYCIDGQWPSKTLVGIEVKDLGYVGEFVKWDDIPEPIRRFNASMAPVFRRYGYRNFFSTEIRIGKDHEPYMIDACCRCGAPPNELYQEFYSNLPDIISAGADGELVDPEPKGKFGVEVIMQSQWANERNWQPLDIPEKIREHVKLRFGAKIGDRHYVVPQWIGLKEIGAIVAWGDTLEAALEMSKSIADQVDGYAVSIPDGAMEEAQEEMQKSAEMGLHIFSKV